MYKSRTAAAFLVVSSILMILGFSTLGSAQELRFLAVAYPPQLVEYLEKTVFPAFEAKHGAKVIMEQVSWDERADKIMLSVAGGVPYDVVVTGFYSPYEEGSLGLLAPLDRYLASWPHTRRFAPALWEAVRWRGQTYVIPQNNDLRVIAYNKALFSEAGLDPEKPPSSWSEMVSYAQRLTRMSGDKVAVRGINLPITGNPTVQNMFWFMRQAGVPETDVANFASNLRKPEAVEALKVMMDLADASRMGHPGLGGGFRQGAVAMERHNPNNRTQVFRTNPELVDVYGLFAPRRTPESTPVAHGFVNGLAILAASKSRDLAWEFISTLYEDEVVIEVERIGGMVTGRVDLARKARAFAPKVELFYDQFSYLQATVIPPPRNIALSEMAQLLAQVFSRKISPEEALLQGDQLYTRLLGEWRDSISK